jgi:hypothetical protein
LGIERIKSLLQAFFGGRMWPPFRTFGENFYTYQLLLDLKVDAGLAIKIEPHPRFYTDPTGSVPIAVPFLREHHGG